MIKLKDIIEKNPDKDPMVLANILKPNAQYKNKWAYLERLRSNRAVRIKHQDVMNICNYYEVSPNELFGYEE